MTMGKVAIGVLAIVLAMVSGAASGLARPPAQPVLTSRAAPIITVEGLRFRDLNRNGTLDIYEDWRLPAVERARNLIAQMTLAEKAGAMMHGSLPFPNGAFGGSAYDAAAARTLLIDRNVTAVITRLAAPAQELAAQNNAMQAIAEGGRLGIPLTISTDPRNHFQFTAGASVQSDGFSQWPEAPGFAAIGDAQTMRAFGDIVRQEYRAVGIHMALSPQADLATEPRWPRIAGTFGEDADLAGRMVGAYTEGFQHGRSGLGPDSVAVVVKHWVGYGAAKDGWDSHNHYGRYATFPTNNFAYHIKPFEPAFAAKAAGVMPTYSILEDLVIDGKPVEQVGGGFNKWLLTDLLRGRYGFDGVILSDWLITADCPKACVEGSEPGQPPAVGMPWGVETLTTRQRFVKGVDAGIDQFGGVDNSELLVEAVRAGELSVSRIEQSAMRVMIQKFELGLFENPFVDPARAAQVVGAKAFQAAADDAQRRSIVLLKNESGLLPLKAGRKVWLHGIAAEAARAAGLVPVASLAEADIALVRAATPFETLHPRYLFGQMHHEGDLSFRAGNKDFDAIVAASAKVPTIVSVFLDRPAILTNVTDKVQGLLGDFGANDAALLAIITGQAKPQGRLPFELPSSMAAVEAQASDLPHDTANPLFKFGFGLDY